jgi:hypothetical protein
MKSLFAALAVATLMSCTPAIAQEQCGRLGSVTQMRDQIAKMDPANGFVIIEMTDEMIKHVIDKAGAPPTDVAPLKWFLVRLGPDSAAIGIAGPNGCFEASVGPLPSHHIDALAGITSASK